MDGTNRWFKMRFYLCAHEGKRGGIKGNNVQRIERDFQGALPV